MAIVVASMVVIVITGVGVLAVVFAMHLAADSAGRHERLRGWAFAAAKWVSASRDALGERLQPAIGVANERLWPVARQRVATVRQGVATVRQGVATVRQRVAMVSQRRRAKSQVKVERAASDQSGEAPPAHADTERDLQSSKVG